MKQILRIAVVFLLLSISTNTSFSQAGVKSGIKIILADTSHRAKFGAAKLTEALKKQGYPSSVVTQKAPTKPAANTIVIGLLNDAAVKNVFTGDAVVKKEGFRIASFKQNSVVIGGADNSGILYGCMDLAEKISAAHAVPAGLSVTDAPQMVMRGACIGVQKPYYLPGRTVYEYPYTPETFPWFYDKSLWIKYLDMMADNRMNALYLWNGHPFASLVRVKEYPYAVEVDSATFKKNEEMFSFLTTEADKRGIWVIQMFYNIIVSKPFAEKHHIKTQDRNRPIIPLIADYTRKSIAAFVEKYPNVGLMVCLGEAMEGVGQDDVEWFTKTIIPGVKDGLKALGDTTQPPIVLRAHDTDAPMVMEAAQKEYRNLYTEAKFNGEALTTYEPRGPWADLHRTLSRIGTVQIENVHILANLEPFRYGAIDFIQKSVKAMHSIYEANGLHLYPQASYWDWPYTADSAGKSRLLQVDRDWIWYKSWSRYAWNCNRSRNDEVNYWAGLLAAKYGCSLSAGKQVLEAYEQSGEISPKILRRYGITDGNRQTMTLGMFMTQLVNPRRYGLFTLLYNSEAPEGEMIIEYAEKEAKQQPHIGETPIQIANEITVHGDKATAAIRQAAAQVTKDKAEFSRLLNDMDCYKAMAYFYSNKAKAAVTALRYKYSNNVSDLEQALPYLQKSVDYFRQLAALTKGTYKYANSMQTQQRKIPINGKNATNKTWVELLPQYEQELAYFKKNIDSLKAGSNKKTVVAIAALQNAKVTINTPGLSTYMVDSNATVFSDTTARIKFMAPELKGLKAVQLNMAAQQAQGTSISFTCDQPVKLLVGFFYLKEKNTRFSPLPNLETDASANEYGQAETKIANALILPGMPPVNVHSYSFTAGTHTLTLAKGAALVLGFVKEEEPLHKYDAGFTENGKEVNIDWLFER
jgi:hypothetical protein